MTNNDLTHFTKEGDAHMVDISEKDTTHREALATGKILMKEDTWNRILNQSHKKGDVLQVARLAGIMASKKTADLIPLCHPIPITHVNIDFFSDDDVFIKEEGETLKQIRCEVLCKTDNKTGIEMEALTATSTTLLTIYDMCKAVDKGMLIKDICLLKKTGGKSGTFKRN